MAKNKKQYTLTFFIGMKNGNEILESVDTNTWFEVADDSSAIIYCVDEKNNSAIAYPSCNLRKIVVNFGLSSDGNIETKRLQLRGYA